MTRTRAITVTMTYLTCVILACLSGCRSKQPVAVSLSEIGKPVTDVECVIKAPDGTSAKSGSPLYCVGAIQIRGSFKLPGVGTQRVRKMPTMVYIIRKLRGGDEVQLHSNNATTKVQDDVVSYSTDISLKHNLNERILVRARYGGVTVSEEEVELVFTLPPHP